MQDLGKWADLNQDLQDLLDNVSFFSNDRQAFLDARLTAISKKHGVVLNTTLSGGVGLN